MRVLTFVAGLAILLATLVSAAPPAGGTPPEKPGDGRSWTRVGSIRNDPAIIAAAQAPRHVHHPDNRRKRYRAAHARPNAGHQQSGRQVVKQ
jgi:hypothetical protein